MEVIDSISTNGLTWRGISLDGLYAARVHSHLGKPCDPSEVDREGTTYTTADEAAAARFVADLAKTGSPGNFDCATFAAVLQDLHEGMQQYAQRANDERVDHTVSTMRFVSAFFFDGPSQYVHYFVREGFEHSHCFVVSNCFVSMCTAESLCLKCYLNQSDAMVELLNAQRETDPEKAMLETSLTGMVALSSFGSLSGLRREQARIELKLVEGCLGFHMLFEPDAVLGSIANEPCVKDHEHTCNETGMPIHFFFIHFISAHPLEVIEARIRRGLEISSVDAVGPVPIPSCVPLGALARVWGPSALRIQWGFQKPVASDRWYELPNGAVGLVSDSLGRTLVHALYMPMRCPPGEHCIHVGLGAKIEADRARAAGEPTDLDE